MTKPRATIAVLGASGLIGAALVDNLLQQGWRVVAVARRFPAAQIAPCGEPTVTCPVADLTANDLGDLLTAHDVDVVVNCLGVLQDGPRGRNAVIHEAFVSRLLEAVRSRPRPVLLMHMSVPGREAEDATDFSRTKRTGERLIAAAGLPFVILRPGFVVAPAAYGGSALIRALAAVPVALPAEVGARPFAVTSVDDIAATVSLVVERWVAGERHWDAVWDLCESQPATVATVVDAFRARFGGPAPRVALPGWLLGMGARAGDAAAWLGWSPPIRTTALREMLRGVEGRPEPWLAAVGIEPANLTDVLRRVPGTVQERWFARLYLLKPVVLVSLVVFWVASGLITLTAGFAQAAAILAAHGFPPRLANAVIVTTSLVDIAIGFAIALRRSCRWSFLVGVAVSFSYLAGAAVLAPDLWGDPLGALVKTAPAIVLMLIALAILDER